MDIVKPIDTERQAELFRQAFAYIPPLIQTVRENARNVRVEDLDGVALGRQPAGTMLRTKNNSFTSYMLENELGVVGIWYSYSVPIQYCVTSRYMRCNVRDTTRYSNTTRKHQASLPPGLLPSYSLPADGDSDSIQCFGMDMDISQPLEPETVVQYYLSQAGGYLSKALRRTKRKNLVVDIHDAYEAAYRAVTAAKATGLPKPDTSLKSIIDTEEALAFLHGMMLRSDEVAQALKMWNKL